MIVQKTSVFPASRDVVFQKLQRLETLQTIAKPYATFEPLDNAATVWTVGSKSSYRFMLFGIIPFGIHTIRIVRLDPEGISSREGNRHVPVWNHDILLVPIDENHTEYTDRVEINDLTRKGVHLTDALFHWEHAEEPLFSMQEFEQQARESGFTAVKRCNYAGLDFCFKFEKVKG